MTKLPTTFPTLDLTGFEFVGVSRGVSHRAQQYTGINREMVDFACAVLQKNRVGVAVCSVNAALKKIYGVGGSTDIICKLVKEWRTDNLSPIEQGKSEKDLATALLEAADDGLLEESEVPEEYLAVSRQMAIAAFRLAFQKADTSVSGDRMKQLAQQNEILQQQVPGYPKLEMELEFYQKEYNRQRDELKEAYMNLNKQQLADSEQFRHQLNSIQAERNELQAKLTVAERRLAEVAEFEAASRDRLSEISNLTGQVEAREREVSSLHVQIQTLQAAMGEKQVLEAQLEQVRSQLKDASATITKLQTQQKTSGALEVDIDPDPVTDDTFMPENETLHGDLSEALKEIEELKAILAKTKAKLPENVFVDSSLDSPESVSVDSPENVSESVSENSRVEPSIQSDSQSASKSKRQKVALAK